MSALADRAVVLETSTATLRKLVAVGFKAASDLSSLYRPVNYVTFPRSELSVHLAMLRRQSSNQEEEEMNGEVEESLGRSSEALSRCRLSVSAGVQGEEEEGQGEAQQS